MILLYVGLAKLSLGVVNLYNIGMLRILGLVAATLFFQIAVANIAVKKNKIKEPALKQQKQTQPQKPKMEEVSCGSSTEDPNTWVDMRKSGESMHQIPVLDQVGLSLCYAYAGTTLASAYINLNATPEFKDKHQADLPLSPYITNFAAILDDNDYCNHPCGMVDYIFKSKMACSSNRAIFTDSGNIREVDQPKVTLGQCIRWEVSGFKDQLKPAVEKVIYAAAADPSLSEHQKVEMVMKELDNKFMYSRWHHLDKKKQKQVAQFALQEQASWRSSIAAIAPQCAKFEESESKMLNSKFVGNLSLDEAFGVKDSNPEEYVKNSPVCDYKNISVEYEGSCKIKKNVDYQPKDFLNDINAAMDIPKTTPVAIDHCYTFYYGRGASPDAPTEREMGGCYFDDQRLRKGRDHKVLLIGRRINPVSKKCEYLIRNSVGNDCNSYYYDFAENCREELAKSGTADVWLPADRLGQNIHGITILKKQK